MADSILYVEAKLTLRGEASIYKMSNIAVSLKLILGYDLPLDLGNNIKTTVTHMPTNFTPTLNSGYS